MSDRAALCVRRVFFTVMSPRLRQSAALVLVSLVVLVGAGTAAVDATVPRSARLRPDIQVPLAGIREHLVTLQAIAERHGGNRLAGTAGYDASARYVAMRMRIAGYSVRFQEFVIPLVVDRSPPALRAVGAAAWSYRAERDYSTLGYSGSDQIEAPVAAVDLLVPSPRPNASTSGCETSDFARFPAGAVALVQRGTCRFRQKVANAVAAGASAVVVFNEGNEHRRGLFFGTLGPPQIGVPALSTSFALGDALRNGLREGPTGVTVRLKTDMIAERRKTRNVIAESRAGNPGNVVVVGAHLDSVQRGPGINDNGSGSAAILEVAEQVAEARPRNRLRFIWWSAEELGLLGSRYYVRHLSGGARRGLALYLNFDMIGSPNFVRFVYDGDGSASPRSRSQLPAGSAAIERVFTQYFVARKLPYRETGLGGSDHLPFVRAGIPVGGLFTGAADLKSAAQAAVFGGRPGRPYDACYHRPCDTLANVSATALDQLANAIAHAVAKFAQDTSSVNGR
jgi:Zn-dependent M28 family amino/carboxypeptidase